MDEFTFKSDAFKPLILFIVLSILISDINTIRLIFQGDHRFAVEGISGYLMYAFGLLLKIGILVSTISMKGPLRTLLYLFGGLLLFVGLAHFFVVWAGGINPASFESLDKLYWLAAGFVLIMPAGHAIQYEYDP